MPPQRRIAREQILEAAMAILRESGIEAINARTLANRIGSSTQPIFSNYRDMEALREDVMQEGLAIFLRMMAEEAESGRYPQYKASGMAYIRFAREEPRLFRALFMRARSENEQAKDDVFFTRFVRDAVENTGISADAAPSFHISMWLFVHGIATLIATGYLSLPEDEIARRITEVYQGIKSQYSGGNHGKHY